MQLHFVFIYKLCDTGRQNLINEPLVTTGAKYKSVKHAINLVDVSEVGPFIILL